MERRKKISNETAVTVIPNKEGLVRWVKRGGGSFRLASGKIIKPNQVFMARPEEIPAGFRDIVVPVNEAELKAVEEGGTLIGMMVKFELRKTPADTYNVVNIKTEKVMNGYPLEKAEAEKLLQELNG